MVPWKRALCRHRDRKKNIMPFPLLCLFTPKQKVIEGPFNKPTSVCPQVPIIVGTTNEICRKLDHMTRRYSLNSVAQCRSMVVHMHSHKFFDLQKLMVVLRCVQRKWLIP